VVRSVTVSVCDDKSILSILSGGYKAGVRHYFVEYPPIWTRETLLLNCAGDFPDNAERYTMFCRAVLEPPRFGGTAHLPYATGLASALVPCCF